MIPSESHYQVYQDWLEWLGSDMDGNNFPKRFLVSGWAGSAKILNVIDAWDRPAFRVIAGQIDASKDDLWGPRLEGRVNDIKNAISGVGRITLTNHPGTQWAGTAFLINAETIVTNRHVLDLFMEIEDGKWRRKHINGLDIVPTINFSENDSVQDAKDEHEIISVLYAADLGKPDIAILRLAEPVSRKPLVLEVSEDMDIDVCVIGYPGAQLPLGKTLREAALRIFGGFFGAMHVSPGKITELEGALILHDCTTLRGHSGSPLLNLDNGTVAGIHYAGGVTANAAISAREILEAWASVAS